MLQCNPNISTLWLAILGLIGQRPCSGYDLVKVFSMTAMGNFSSSPGAVYPALKRLEQLGLIEGALEGRETLRPRRIYSLTQRGRLALEQRLSMPVTREDVARHSDDLMLRFAFMEGVLGREKTIAFLEQMASQTDAYIAELKRQLADMPPSAPSSARYALEHGIESYRADARWARRIIRELKEGTPGTPAAGPPPGTGQTPERERKHP